MDEELIGRFNGYAQWGAEVHWNRRTDDVQKQQLITALRSNRGHGFAKNKEVVQELKSVIQKKQLPAMEMYGTVASDIRETARALKTHFMETHAELHVTDIVHGTSRVHENVAAFYDTLKRQEKILVHLNEPLFNDLIPHLFFLYDKELQQSMKIWQHSRGIYDASVRVVKHVHENYFSRLRQVSVDKQFFNDHKDILLAAYIISVSGRTVGNVHGLNTTEGRQVEAEFIKNFAEVVEFVKAQRA